MPADSRVLPRSVALALLWTELDAPHTATLLFDDDEPHTLGARPLLEACRELDARHVWPVLPAPGDPQGLPPGAAAHAVVAGEAVVVEHPGGTTVLVPDVVPFGTELEPGVLVRWRAHDGAGVRGPAVSPGEARLALHAALQEAIAELTALDVAKERPDLREAFLDLTGPPDRDTDALTHGLDDRRAELLLRAVRVLTITALAAQDDGAAVTAGQMNARSAVLRELERSARAAVAVASVQVVRRRS
ncbi:hypothetical protein C8046_01260 [Serinibacter arcticus]|uniref:Uncharacterized protein n=1 Tax=Serinibacter arcticus TaxID=1655435 RepID=A0A2U1ZRC2_9MICO|nr:hypothetical protein [Serinibacter arcticus]PWD49545.1 hypothetical protein C8046_01260 [Serinibacter arcticus]